MDLLNALSPESNYSTTQLQLIVAAWVLSKAVERNEKISVADGDVLEADYHKGSVYSLLYAIYRSMGQVRSATGEHYEVTFNTWGYAWPEEWGPAPTTATDPQRFGKNAYTGLFQFPAVKEYVRASEGRVHVVEMGCGTGAGAHHVCQNVLRKCTYEAVDMQEAAIQTCRRKFVPELGGRLLATRADCTELGIPDATADIVAVCETHVTELPGQVTDEDRRFFGTVKRILRPGGFLVWGNVIPDRTWPPCFDLLDSIGMKHLETRDVTPHAIAAREQDRPRVDAYLEQCLERFVGFRIPVLGPERRLEARQALANFYRNPGTRLYADMITGNDSYKVCLFTKGS